MFRWLGSITGIIGALMLAMNMEFSKWGYVFFLTSSLILTIIFIRDKDWAMTTQQSIFLVINTIGFVRWIL